MGQGGRAGSSCRGKRKGEYDMREEGRGSRGGLEIRASVYNANSIDECKLLSSVSFLGWYMGYVNALGR